MQSAKHCHIKVSNWLITMLSRENTLGRPVLDVQVIHVLLQLSTATNRTEDPERFALQFKEYGFTEL